MFYFFLAPLLSYHWLLIIAAIVPAVFLMIKVYRSDRLEREDPALLRRLVLVGVLSTFIALVLEWIGEKLLGLFFDESSQAYMILRGSRTRGRRRKVFCFEEDDLESV